MARGARQFLTHAVRGREPGRVDRHLGLAFTPQRYVRVDAAIFQLQQIRLVAVARIGQYHRRLDPKRLVDLVEHPHQLTLVAGLWPHLSRDDDLVLPIDRHLRVVALLESLAAGLHDLALGIGEIALRLRFGLAVGPLVGPPAPGIAVLPRLAPALRRLQTRFGCLDRRQALLPALQLLGQLVAPEILAPTLVFFGVHHPRLRQQRLDLRLQASQMGFFDIANRYAGLDAKNAPLVKIDEVVPWEDFRPRLEAAWRKPAEDRKSPAGRKPWDALVMFKAIVLCALYNLSDDQVEYQLRDRLSFMRFLGLGLEDRVPDAKTVWLYREHLAQAGVIEALFDAFDGSLKKRGYLAMGGQIIDASIVPVPQQRNSRDENARIKDGETPEGWEKQPAKRRQKDTDARWTKKHGKSHCGYKNHVNVDRRTDALNAPAPDRRDKAPSAPSPSNRCVAQPAQ